MTILITKKFYLPIRLTIIYSFLAMVGLNVSAAESSQPKLEPIDNTNFDTLLVASSFKIPLTRKIYIEDPQVSFAKDWLIAFSNTDSYQKRIAMKYGNSLKNNLEKELISSGWKIMDAPGAETVRLDPRIVDLYITAPESIGSKHSVVTSFGNAKVELTFKSPSNQPFMQVIDQRATPNKSGGEANQASNFRYFNKLMESWSKGSIYYLEQIMLTISNIKK